MRLAPHAPGGTVETVEILTCAMLPSAYRMRRSADFTAVVRAGQRAGTPTVVIHHRSGLRTDGPALVGLVVGRSVGNSVVRHRVSRRLRAQLAARLSTLPAGSGTVVRARPAAAPASSTQLGRDLDQGLGRVLTSGMRGGSATRSRAEARG